MDRGDLYPFTTLAQGLKQSSILDKTVCTQTTEHLLKESDSL